MTRPIAVLVHTLYLTVTGVSLMVYIQSGGAILFWNDVIDAQGLAAGVITEAQKETAHFWRVLSVWGGGALIVLGTLATTFYGLIVRKGTNQED